VSFIRRRKRDRMVNHRSVGEPAEGSLTHDPKNEEKHPKSHANVRQLWEENHLWLPLGECRAVCKHRSCRGMAVPARKCGLPRKQTKDDACPHLSPPPQSLYLRDSHINGSISLVHRGGGTHHGPLSHICARRTYKMVCVGLCIRLCTGIKWLSLSEFEN
jgi:hypothetical protein